jgi:hypothetical protein
MATVVKHITDVRSNTSSSVNFQPASGKFWWFNTLRFELSLNTANRVGIQRGTTGLYPVTFHQENNVTDYDDSDADGSFSSGSGGLVFLMRNSGSGTPFNPHCGDIPLRDPSTYLGSNSGALWATNAAYLRVTGAASGDWGLAWFGVEVDV